MAVTYHGRRIHATAANGAYKSGTSSDLRKPGNSPVSLCYLSHHTQFSGRQGLVKYKETITLRERDNSAARRIFAECIVGS
jgi:hypothetical protein